MDKQQARTAKTIIILVLVLLFVMGLSLLIISKSPKDYGVFLDKGLLDAWELRNGIATLTIEGDNENFKDYKIYLTEGTKILKATYSDDKKNQSKRTLKPGDYKEIQDGMFVEIYLENPYEDVTRQAKTIIYWE